MSIQGNSGPYLQYALVRARSVLAKAPDAGAAPDNLELEGPERSLARAIGEWPEVVLKASNEYLPHHLCSYLYELAQVFNRFYEQSPIIGHQRQDLRLNLTKAYTQTLSNGLAILGIQTPDSM